MPLVFAVVPKALIGLRHDQPFNEPFNDIPRKIAQFNLVCGGDVFLIWLQIAVSFRSDHPTQHANLITVNHSSDRAAAGDITMSGVVLGRDTSSGYARHRVWIGSIWFIDSKRRVRDVIDRGNGCELNFEWEIR